MDNPPFRFFLITAVLVTSLNSALAGPPSSCACKFIGTWSFSSGTTTVWANGLAYPKCGGCVAVQTWTCQGNTYLFSNSGPPGQFSQTLIDSTHMQGSGGIATRVGGAGCPTENATPKPTAKGIGCPGSAMSYVVPVALGNSHDGRYKLRNSCADKAINVQYSTTGPKSNNCDIASGGPAVIPPGGQSSDTVYSYCAPPKILRASFVQ
jgi:hypothetical protein